MSDGASMTFKRRDALFAKLRRSRPAITSELVKAVNKSAEEHASAARTLVAKDEGDLEASIEATALTGGINPAAEVTAGEDNFPAKAHWIEYGTPPHKQGGVFAGTQHPGTKAQPFMFPSYRLLLPRAKRRIARAIATGIKRGTK